MKDITRFIQTELEPRFFNYIPQIFPQLKFTKKGNKYISPLHADLSEYTGERPDRSVVTEPKVGKKCVVWDNPQQKPTDVITLFMQLNNISEVWEAVDNLCSIVGIPKPEYTPEAKENYRKAEERRTILEQSLERQKAAIFEPEGKDVLEYMHARKWKDEDIKKAELGCISKEEAKAIGAADKVGTHYRLSIPIRSGNTLHGFKFRSLGTDGQRFTNLTGMKSGSILFNLTGVQQSKGEIVVVESELDALLAHVRGIKGAVATDGGYLTEELLDVAIKRGISSITLLFDKDKAGEDYIGKSIEAVNKKCKAENIRDISLFVATLPDEILEDGKPLKDVDDYLRNHTAEELQNIIDNAQSAPKYALRRIIDKAEEISGILTDKNLAKLNREVINLANGLPNEMDREFIFKLYADHINLDQTAKEKVFSPESIRAVADEERRRGNEKRKERETRAALQEAKALADEGSIDEALQKMEEITAKARKIETYGKYSRLLSLPTEEALTKRLRNKPDELQTLYELSNGNDKEVFSLPSGAITFICAPTSHGKSTLLQNLALQIAQGEGEGDVLYFTFEEDGDAVTEQMLNKFIGVELCRNYDSKHSNNMRAIRHFFKTGEDMFITPKELFYQKKKEFMEGYYSSGKIRIYYEDYDSAELIAAIRTISSQTKVKAVFIDYIQLLNSRAYKAQRLQRTEELKEICKDLKNLSIETQLPIVVAAQLNRETTSPLELHSQRIAEAADLERIANKILCLWNTSFVAQKSKDSKGEIEALEDRFNFKLGGGGKIYAKLTKNRGGVAGLENVFYYNGNTGIITEEPQQNKPDSTEINLRF